MSIKERWSGIIGRLALLLVLVACQVPGSRPAMVATQAPPATRAPLVTPTPSPDDESGLTREQAATLGSLRKVDEYPLYTMQATGSLDEILSDVGLWQQGDLAGLWVCSLFAALADPESRLLGRNFDWEYSPALLLFSSPSDGYASASMVDMAYLGLDPDDLGDLIALPLEARRPLLRALLMPFDGMNEQGVAVGMAAVPDGNMEMDPAKVTVSSLMIMRLILDRAADVEEALAIMLNHNIDMEGGPPLHYLLSDRSGRALVVEFHQGEMVVIEAERPWVQATNFLLSSAPDSPEGRCWRYDRISQALSNRHGVLTADGGMALLRQVSVETTQWSAIYDMSTGGIQVWIGAGSGRAHRFSLDLAR